MALVYFRVLGSAYYFPRCFPPIVLFLTHGVLGLFWFGQAAQEAAAAAAQAAADAEEAVKDLGEDVIDEVGDTVGDVAGKNKERGFLLVGVARFSRRVPGVFAAFIQGRARGIFIYCVRSCPPFLLCLCRR